MVILTSHPPSPITVLHMKYGIITTIADIFLLAIKQGHCPPYSWTIASSGCLEWHWNVDRRHVRSKYNNLPSKASSPNNTKMIAIMVDLSQLEFLPELKTWKITSHPGSFPMSLCNPSIHCNYCLAQFWHKMSTHHQNGPLIPTSAMIKNWQ